MSEIFVFFLVNNFFSWLNKKLPLQGLAISLTIKNELRLLLLFYQMNLNSAFFIFVYYIVSIDFIVLIFNDLAFFIKLIII